MKTQNSIILRTLITLILVAVILPACAQSDSKQQRSSEATIPEIDIQTAVISGNLAVVKQHIEAGTDLNKKDPMSGSTALITAATFNKIEIAEALINGGADLSLKNSDGSTALHSAAFFCRIEIVQMLIDAEVDKSIRNNFGATARESVMGPFEPVQPIYAMMQEQLAPFGLQLDLEELKKTRPVIAMMLQ
tara:strand:+ start:10154 stop:10726 length:573 start_codon:yes stop_codon:yes gene_type:complete